MSVALHDAAVRSTAIFVAREAPRKAEGMPHGELEACVRAAMARAKKLGVTETWDIYRFSLFAVLFGVAFYESETWAREVCADESLGWSAKMDRLEATFRNYLAKTFR